MTGYTPGPWKWNGAAGIYGANGKRCANVFVAGEINLPDKEIDANAHLIEAVTELLEALEGILNNLWKDRKRNVRRDYALMVYESQAKAAISKARGAE